MMPKIAVERGVEIIRRDGIISFLKATFRFIAHQVAKPVIMVILPDKVKRKIIYWKYPEKFVEDKYDSAINEIYQSTELQSPTIRVLDIGARGGFQSKLSVIHENEKLDFVGIEPDSEECNRLKSNYPKYDWYDTAFSDDSGTEELHLAKRRARASLYKPNPEVINRFDLGDDGYYTEETTTVQVTTVDEFVGGKDYDFDIVKIDAEGSEGDIIVGGEQTLQNVFILEFEANFKERFKNSMTFCEIHKFLGEHGFEIMDIKPEIRKRLQVSRNEDLDQFDGELIFGDVYYFQLKNELSLSNYTKKIVLCLIYRKKSIAYHILEKSKEEMTVGEYKEMINILDSIPR